MIFNISRGKPLKLPMLDADFPADVSVTYNYNDKASATFEIVISKPGKPDQYIYEWYVNGLKIEGANGASYTVEMAAECTDVPVYCRVYNKAGSVQSKTATLTAVCNDLVLIEVSPMVTVSGNGYSQQGDCVKLRATLNVACYIQTEMLDLTAFKTLTGVFTYWADSSNGFFWRIYDSGGSIVKSSDIGFCSQGTYTDETRSIDVTDLTGNHYIEFRRDATSSGAYLDIKNLKLLS